MKLKLTVHEIDEPREAMRAVSIPYAITTRNNGFLPDMSDFSLERLGSIDTGWSTSSTIKAGRALVEGEVLSAFLIDRLNGDIRKIDYTAQKGELSISQWPKAFADHLAAAGEPITAGGWSADNNFSTASEPLRLWSPSRYRAFSTAPFAANIVQALACDESFSPRQGDTLCLQVRDLTTQALYEHHFFTPTAAQAGEQWSKALCEQINRDSRLLRAGVLEGSSVTPALSGNAFWVPQCAELSVTLTEARWWQSQAVEAEQPLEDGQTLQAWVYDAFTHRLLAQHQWTPGESQRAAGKWPAAWARALNASPVSPYLRVATYDPQAARADEADQLRLWQRGDALRIFTTLPDAADLLPGATLLSAWKADPEHAVLVTVRHPFSRQLLHRALFKPQDADQVNDRTSWLEALADFLKAQAWPEVQIGASTEPLRVLRFSELQVTVDNVGDGKTWSDGDYVNYLLETDDWPGRMPVEQAQFKVASKVASVQIDVTDLNGELVFRLDRTAHDKGYRVAACVPQRSEHPIWPVDVSDTQVTWVGPIKNGVYDLHLTYPESARDSTALTVGHIGAFHPTHFWHGTQAVEFTPPAPMREYEEISFLCEDYGNTNHSEVFDTSNQDRTGVDERSGLFHAHYPIATLQGLHGLGPVCDLTLHYSALRANEAGLGDGWAWRFSRIITSSTQVADHRVLTLADGTPVVFSDEQWKQLSAGEAVKTQACRVTCNKDYSEFTVEFPSGRKEILSKPAAPGSDTIEPNDEFRKKVLQILKAIKAKSVPQYPTWPDAWTQWILLVISPIGYHAAAAIDYSEAVSAWESHGMTKDLDRRIAMYERPFVQLLPSRIVSQYGEALDLQWKRQNGQFLLMSIKSGDTELFTATYDDPQVKAGSQVKMQLWPGSDEAFSVELKLEQFLLRTLKRVQGKKVLQQVDCGYDDDPTLDRVLCRLQEQDGSVECVQYVKKDATLKSSPALPRVVLHALLPGGGQQNHIHRYTYTGSFQNPDDQLFITAVESGPHAEIQHDLHGYGLDTAGNRTPLLQGVGSAHTHWLDFVLRHEQTTTTIRYTGLGDELAAVIENMVVRLSASQLEISGPPQLQISADAPPVERQQAVLQLLWRYSGKNRKRLQAAIGHMLSLAPKAQRENLGKTVEATTIVTDGQGNPLRLYTSGSHGVHYSYYGDQTQNQITLAGVEKLSKVPTLECPFVPAYASAPLMAEYQCDEYGNPQGLKLYGYEKVTRAGHDYLELAEVVLVHGIRGTLVNDTLGEDTTWQLSGSEVLWHQVSSATTIPTSKKTASNESKVQEWSITSKQTSHHADQSMELIHEQKFVDNPNEGGIRVTVSTTTAAGTAQVSKELRSRYSRRALQKVENGVETHWQRDALGRVTQETRYVLASGSTGKADKQDADERIDSAYKDNGKQVERTHKDKSQSLSCLDGLQRAWRSAWRRAADENYVPVDECCYSGLDEAALLGSWAWDYLPGGQAVRKDRPLRGLAGRQPWLEQEALGSQDDQVPVDKQANVSDVYLQTADTLNERDEHTLTTHRSYTTFVASVCRFLQQVDSQKPHRRSPLRLENDSYDVNTIGVAYVKIRAAARDAGLRITDEYRLMKYIQNLAKLKDSEGLTDAIMVQNHESETGRVALPIPRDFSKAPPIKNIRDVFACFSLGPYISETNISTKLEEIALDLLWKSTFSQVYSVVSLASEDQEVKTIEQQGLGPLCLSKRTTTRTVRSNGTFEHSVQWADHASTQHLQLDQKYDANGHITHHARTVGKQTLAYSLERDLLGRVTKVTRPDTSTIERTYHGFSNQVTRLTVDGNVIATQTVTDPGKLKTRKVGSREYGLNDQTVTLPDKTQLQTLRDAKGTRLEANGSALFSQTNKDGVAKLKAEPTETGIGWQHTLISAQVPGRRQTVERTPRGTLLGNEWQTLRGQSIAALRADGRTQRVFLDGEGRMLRSCQEHEDVLYRYDELGRLQVRQVHALTGAGQWQVHSERDGFNRETERTFLRNGAPCFSQRMAWRGDGRLESKASYQDGKLLRTERFTYDQLDRLESYTCNARQAALCPHDGKGTPIKAQTFTWDSLDNLTSCTSTPFKGDAVTETFNYGTATDPTRLSAVKTGQQTRRLSWNKNGQLQADGQRALAYTAAGQLSSVKDERGALLARYEYDGLQRLAAQYCELDQTTRELRYDGDELIGEVCYDKTGNATRSTCISPGLAQYDDDQVRWLIDDPQVGIVGQVCDGQLQLAPLLPFGEGTALKGLVSGYNGMRRDPVTGQYHAGNGYRSYDPTLRRYAQPDWLSPFGEGGINDYAHCPDPVNLHDPSGAIMLSRWGQDQEVAYYERKLRETKPFAVDGRWRGLALSAVLTVVGIAASIMTGGAASVLFIAMTTCAVLSFGFEVASVLTAKSNPELSRKLGYASLAFAVASLFETALGLIKKIPGWIKHVMHSVRQAGKTLRRFMAGTRLARNAVSPAAYAMQELGALGGIGRAAEPARRGVLATLKAGGGWMLDYLGGAQPIRLANPRYARMGAYGRALRAAHRLNNFATRSRLASSAAWITGYAVDGFIAYNSGATFKTIATGDTSTPISPWGRYSIPLEERHSWDYGVDGHLLT
ncbi:RHS repeat-associated core domain-containing protein [Pseudomonas vlassakiae]|uniref:RHS repeat-associated core domain-containing protein n=1 Tax=Pseudomonas vlassakiae TaxID=485888 RepID=UPI003FD8E75B